MYIRDTIAAIATPPGEGAMAVLRLSGPDALPLATRIFRGCPDGDLQSHRFYYGRVADPDTEDILDEVMLVAMVAPRSYTREDVVEIHCHGGTVVVRRLLEMVLRSGARVAEPGEFTRRAFLNGRIDLTQAESVLDIIRARTDLSLSVAQKQRSGLLGRRIDLIKAPLVEALAYLEASLDFPEDEVGATTESRIRVAVQEGSRSLARLLETFREGRIIHDGATVMIAGVPNVGKSSLMNALLEEERAIVTPIPGTTRDIIEDSLVIDGISVRLLDTAGLRDTLDPVEQVGVRFVRDRLASADLVLLVLDASRPMEEEERGLVRELSGRPLLVVSNKSDLPGAIVLPAELQCRQQVAISARTGFGLDVLKQAIHDHFVLSPDGICREALFITNRRHADLVRRAGESLEHFLAVTEEGLPLEIAALELRLAVDSLGEITGAVSTDDLLDVIFSAFCVGK